MKLELSPLGHSWFLDLDGTILKHNGHLLDGEDSFLSGAKEFLDSIPKTDCILFTTSRTLEQKEGTEDFLQKHGVRFHQIIYGLPYGERILVNDSKPSGLEMAIALNTKRDCCIQLEIEVNEDL